MQKNKLPWGSEQIRETCQEYEMESKAVELFASVKLTFLTTLARILHAFSVEKS